MEDLKVTLDSFLKIKGVTYILLSNSQGEILEFSGEENPDLPLPALMAIDLIQLSYELPPPYKSNELSQSFMEFKDMNFIAIPIKQEYFLLIISSPEVNIGRIRLEIKKCRKNLESILP